jgi:hypothetical protein
MTEPKVIEHLIAAGRKGGSARTEKQLRARRLNLYRALAVRHPQSVKIRTRLAELEQEEVRTDEATR